MSGISAWYDFVLQQMVAESYLDGIDLSNRDAVAIRLQNGNNHYSLSLEKFTSYTRMTEVQADDFLKGYEVIDQRSNDLQSGFSATLMKNMETGNNRGQTPIKGFSLIY